MLIAFAIAVALGLSAVLVVAVMRFRSAGTEMDLVTFFRRLAFGGGFKSVGPAQFAAALAKAAAEAPLLIDLRVKRAFDQDHIPGAESRWFDDFLRDVVVDEKYGDDKHRPIFLVCDTGHMSRVVGAVLAEDEGFTRVYNLRGGMQAWARWRARVARLQRCALCMPLAKCCA